MLLGCQNKPPKLTFPFSGFSNLLVIPLSVRTCYHGRQDLSPLFPPPLFTLALFSLLLVTVVPTTGTTQPPLRFPHCKMQHSSPTHFAFLHICPRQLQLFPLGLFFSGSPDSVFSSIITIFLPTAACTDISIRVLIVVTHLLSLYP